MMSLADVQWIKNAREIISSELYAKRSAETFEMQQDTLAYFKKGIYSGIDELAIFRKEICVRAASLIFKDAKFWGNKGIPEEALLDEGASHNRFRRELAPKKTILEFGSGGSTIEAAKNGCNIVSVESDGEFLSAVSDKLRLRCPSATIHRLKVGTDAFNKTIYAPSLDLLPPTDPHRQTVVLIHSDIGPTTALGYPKDRRNSESNLKVWSCYPRAPWDAIDALSLSPDAILVDGRFRVSCAALSLAYAVSHPDTSILFDDYAHRRKGRWNYGKIETLARASLHGRMSELEVLPETTPQACMRIAALMSSDFH